MNKQILRPAFISVLIGLAAFTSARAAGKEFAVDTLKTPTGDIRITCIGHGTLMLEFGGKVIHVDPWSKLADYGSLPKADIILVTHEHRDHLDPAAIKSASRDGTIVLANASAASAIPGSETMKNGETKTVDGITIEAVPAYNVVHMRSPGQPFHPKGSGNGYVVTLGGKKIYIAGDTENVPEMKGLKDIECAFLPMNLPYTMTPEMTAEAARDVKPKILYPYHFGETDTSKLVELLKDSGIEVRIREFK